MRSAGLERVASYAVYKTKLAEFKELLKRYEVGKREDLKVDAAARMVGLEVKR
jgi:hypothetical protein